MHTAKGMFSNLFNAKADSVCEVCGNVYDKCFEVQMNGNLHVFDCFECAIHTLAPNCAHCGCQIIGHGVEADGIFYCCSHCARKSGVYEDEHQELEKAAH